MCKWAPNRHCMYKARVGDMQYWIIAEIVQKLVHDDTLKYVLIYNP